MHLFASLLAGAALVASVIAQGNVAFTEWPSSMKVGEPVTLKWIGGTDSPATIALRKGDSTDLKDVKVLTADARGGSFEWTPGSDLTDASDYAFQITQDGQVNYSGLIPVSGGSANPSPAPAAPAAPTTAASTSSPAVVNFVAAPVTSASTTASGKPLSTVSAGTVPVAGNSTFRPKTLSSAARSTSATVVATSTISGTSAAKAASTAVSTGGASSITSSLTLILSVFAAFYVR